MQGWLSIEQIQLLSQSEKGQELLLLINDFHQISILCDGITGYNHKTFVAPKKLPFPFSTDPDQMMNNMMVFYNHLADHALFDVDFVKTPSSVKPMKEQLSGVDFINFQRMRVRVLLYLIVQTEFICVEKHSFFVSFLKAVELGLGRELAGISTQAFDIWIGLQFALMKLSIDKTLYRLENYDFFKSATHFFFSLFDEGRVSTESIIANYQHTSNYIVSVLLPQTVIDEFFKYPFSRGKKDECHYANGVCCLSSFPEKIKTGVLSVGEEFEYFTEEGKLPCAAEAEKILQEWEKHILKELRLGGIEDFSITPTMTENDLTQRNTLNALNIRIGDWYCKVYHDVDHKLEVNTSPYTLEQVFTIQGLTVSPYHLFDLYIINIARKLNLIPCSGHKHIGVVKAFRGNGELILRLLLDVERRGFIPRFLKREQKSHSVYPYMSHYSPIPAPALTALVNLFNAQLEVCSERKVHEDNGALYMQVTALRRLGLWNNKRQPLNLQHLRAGVVESNDNCVKQPATTIEFRFPQAARSGEEARRWNELFIAWIQLMEKHQRANLKLSIELDNPMNYASGRDAEVVASFKGFIGELGLDWNAYQSCSFLGRTPENAGSDSELSPTVQVEQPMDLS